MTPPRERRWLHGFLWFLLGSILLIPGRTLLTGEIAVWGDLAAYHLPTRWFYADGLRKGGLPIWCPWINNGVDLHAEGQVGMAHPLHWLIYRFLPLPLGFEFERYWGWPFLTMGTMLWLRRWGLSRSAAMMGGLVLLTSPFLIARQAHLNAFQVFAHTPWLIWTADLATRASRLSTRLWAGWGFGLLIASCLLLGAPQFALISGCVAALFWTLRGWVDRPQSSSGMIPRSRIGFQNCVYVLIPLLVWTALGVMLAAVQLAPTLELWSASQRDEGPARIPFTQSPLVWSAWLQVVAPIALRSGFVRPEAREPDFLTEEYALALGAVPLTWSLWLLTRRPRSDDPAALARLTRLALGSVGLGVMCAILAFWEAIPWGTWWEPLPILGWFRMHIRWTLGLVLAVAVATGCAWEALRLRQTADSSANRDKEPIPVRWWSALALASLVITAGLVVPQWIKPDLTTIHPHSWPFLIWGPLAFPIAAGLTTWALRGGGERAGALLALFLALDALLVGHCRIAPPSTVRYDDWLNARPLPPETVPVGSVVRVGFEHIYHLDVNSLIIGGRVRVHPGVLGLIPRARLNLWNSRRAARVYGVAAQAILEDRRITGWETLPDPLPRVRLVEGWRLSDDPANDLERPDHDPARVVLVDRAPQGWTRSHRQANSHVEDTNVPPPALTIRRDQPGLIEIALEGSLDQPMLMVLSERFFPGWRVEIDGEERDGGPIRADGDFQAVLVSPGCSRVLWTYDPPRFRQGAAVSLAALGLFVASAGVLSVSGALSASRARASLETGALA